MSGNPSSPNPRAEEIYFKALEITDRAERLGFLQKECEDDPRLRSDVDALLVNDPGSACDEIPSGTRIGKYVILEKLDRGGCGVVYRAEQQNPFTRQVAIKVLRPEMHGSSVLERFKQEQRMLASFSHPGIVNIFDAGEIGDRPYFVMEYIDGQTITKYADAHRFTIEERLVVFIDVCEAVQEAHSKGIIHRDLKPANILVTERVNKPVPKIIDFGISKAIGEEGGLTRTGQFPGTLAYMSPEQLGFSGTEPDKRTDIYSLGVLLYELLVGCPPLDLSGRERDEILRIIRAISPEAPSVRILAFDNEARTMAAKYRGIDPSNFGRVLSGGLDRIVMKCMEKDRDKRYASVSCLEKSIQNYLKQQTRTTQPRASFSSVISEVDEPDLKSDENDVEGGESSNSTAAHAEMKPAAGLQTKVCELINVNFRHFWLADSIFYTKNEALGRSELQATLKKTVTKPLLFVMPGRCVYECYEEHYALGFYWLLCVVLFSYAALVIRGWRNIP